MHNKPGRYGAGCMDSRDMIFKSIFYFRIFIPIIHTYVFHCLCFVLKRQDDPLKLYVPIYFSHRTDESICNVPTLLQSLVLTSLDPWWAPRIASWVYQSIWRKLSWYHPVQPPCSFVLRLKVPEKGSHHLSVMSELLLSTGTENTKVKKKMKSELMPQLLLLIYTFLIEIYFFSPSW